MNKQKRQNTASVLENLLDQITPAEQALIDDRMTVSANIDDLLKQHGWSKKAFAEKLGKDPSVITRWLSGTHNFTTETLSEIRVVFGVTLMELVRECKSPLVLLPDNRIVQQRSTFSAVFIKGPSFFNSTGNENSLNEENVEVATTIRSPWLNMPAGKSIRQRNNNRLRKNDTK